MLAILIMTIKIATILSHKLPEVDMVVAIDSMDWLTQQCLDTFVLRVLHMTQVLQADAHVPQEGESDSNKVEAACG